jgi:hypothetical protein
METRVIEDYFVAIVPVGINVNDVESYSRLIKTMKGEAYRAIMEQYKQPPRALIVAPIEWLVTNSPKEVERFQPIHDCNECRAGNLRARQYLTANPDRFLACANLRYTEVWASST